MLLFGLHLVLQKYYSYVLIQLHTPSASFPLLFSWKLDFFFSFSQASRKIKKNVA